MTWWALLFLALASSPAEEICFTYTGTDVDVVVSDTSGVLWDASVPVKPSLTWSGGTDERPVTILFEGLNDGKLEMTAWANVEPTGKKLATGELAQGAEACVTYLTSNN